jgi:hypothetical protein
MTEQMDAILVNASAEQFLLGEHEQAFISCCDEVCIVSNGSDGWPAIQVLRAPAVSLEVIHSGAVRASVETGAWAGAGSSAQKIVLILTRYGDGLHLMLHGHLAPSRDVGEGEESERRMRISIAACSWSPAVLRVGDAALSRALTQR